MSETVVEEQLELVSIIEVSQLKLSRNFTILLNKITRHEDMFQKNQLLMDALQAQQNLSTDMLEQKITSQLEKFTLDLSTLQHKVNALEDASVGKDQRISLNADSIQQAKQDLFSTQLQFEEKMQFKAQQMEALRLGVEKLEHEQMNFMEEINKKESKVNAEASIKELEQLKAKHLHLQNQLKAAHHKIEKIQILSQKAEREKAKKDAELTKQIEEKVLKEARNIINSSSSKPVLQMSSGEKTNENLPMRQTSDPANDYFKVNVEEALEKWSERIKLLENNAKESQENLKSALKNVSGMKKTEAKESSSEGIKEKINEIKPEIIKLWAKMDTLEDRLSFNQRKLDQKLKIVSDLAILIKENNTDKLQEKIKALQTELFTSLKEVKAKMESKVKQSDYEKQCIIIDDRIQQINEIILLKSDKLEVKKALLFLESKIKEIILVISEDEQNEKDALLTKKQLKCMSCDKQFDKFNGVISSPKGNWDCMPMKDHPPQMLGRFGMTNFGSLAKKIKRLEGKDLPVLNKKNNLQSTALNQSNHQSPS